LGLTIKSEPFQVSSVKQSKPPRDCQDKSEVDGFLPAEESLAADKQRMVHLRQRGRRGGKRSDRESRIIEDHARLRRQYWWSDFAEAVGLGNEIHHLLELRRCGEKRFPGF